GDAEVIARLKSLSDQLEAKALTPAEQTAERGVILDALLPAQPRELEMPPASLHTVMEAASAVGRAERLRGAGLLQADEAAAERAAIERQLDGGSGYAAAPAPTRHASARHAKSKGKAKAGNSASPALILATAPSEDEARATWEKIKAKYPEELGSMNAAIRQVGGGAKGPRWRVVAGPVETSAEARRLCKALKLYRQSCTVGIL
ncbi:MAG: hypothetical protein RLZZ501_2564, partial [Pseudomonadota bacterium]